MFTVPSVQASAEEKVIALVVGLIGYKEFVYSYRTRHFREGEGRAFCNELRAVWTDEEFGLWDQVEAAKMGDAAHHSSNLLAALWQRDVEKRLPDPSECGYPIESSGDSRKDLARICCHHFEELVQLADKADWTLVRRCWEAEQKVRQHQTPPGFIPIDRMWSTDGFPDIEKMLRPFLAWRSKLLAGAR